jgi:hypothetical protein
MGVATLQRIDRSTAISPSYIPSLGHQYGDECWRTLGQVIAIYIAPPSPVRAPLPWHERLVGCSLKEQRLGRHPRQAGLDGQRWSKNGSRAGWLENRHGCPRAMSRGHSAPSISPRQEPDPGQRRNRGIFRAGHTATRPHLARTGSLSPPGRPFSGWMRGIGRVRL